MDEIREHVKRMQDYTQGLEEAYDELLDELEETKAANKDMEKKLDISLKLIQELKEEATTTSAAFATVASPRFEKVQKKLDELVQKAEKFIEDRSKTLPLTQKRADAAEDATS